MISLEAVRDRANEMLVTHAMRDHYGVTNPKLTVSTPNGGPDP